VADFNGDGGTDVLLGGVLFLGNPARFADLSVEVSHSGTFVSGQTITYTISIANVGAGPTSGTLTVADKLPRHLTASAIAGTGWNCTLASLTCTRSDALGPNLSYPTITIAASVPVRAVLDSAPARPTNVVDSVIVSGANTIGGEYRNRSSLVK
jgi:uncharacterized repeat protein (TIGR01451 family)